MKGTEAQTYLEELRHSHLPPSSASGGPRGSERDLLDQIVHLEKEVRSRDAVIGDLRERHAASSGNEARFLREENEDLKVCTAMTAVVHVECLRSSCWAQPPALARTVV